MTQPLDPGRVEAALKAFWHENGKDNGLPWSILVRHCIEAAIRAADAYDREQARERYERTVMEPVDDERYPDIISQNLMRYQRMMDAQSAAAFAQGSDVTVDAEGAMHLVNGNASD